MAEWSTIDLSPVMLYDTSDTTTLYNAASGGSNTTDGGTVLRWEDISGNGHHLAISANGPTHRDNAFLGKTVLQFDGSNDRLDVPTPSGLLANDDKTIAFVIQTRTTGALSFGFGTAYNDGSVNNTSRGYFAVVGTDQNLNYEHSSSGQAIVSGGSSLHTMTRIFVMTTTVASSGSPPTVIWYRDGNSLSLTTNTITYTNATYTEQASGSTALGGLFNYFYASFLIGELAVWDSVLSTADRQKLEGYLSHKWGTGLASGHPYANKHQYGVPGGAGAARGIR